MVKQKIVWSCKECGASQAKWSGSCSVCRNWGTFVEEKEIVDVEERFSAKKKDNARPLRVSEVQMHTATRLATGLKEVDSLLGGGLVKGSLLLLGGEPGIGKSTLMLQLAHALSSQGLVVLYICGEESVEQTSLRAHRLGVGSETLFLFSETQFSSVKKQIDILKPDILIVDSIQILYKGDIPSAPGSVVQVRELATEFMHLAKGHSITTFLIGHVTKSGEIAGPRVLEHIVDVVLDFEGDRQQGYRLLRGTKNRFGPTDDIVLFQMKQEGLSEIANPSQEFLKERKAEHAGTVVMPMMEGSRAFLVEIQALVGAAFYASPTRRSTGVDQNRLAILLAILEKKMGYALHRTDVFVSVAGGFKIIEPAADLAIVMAITSSFANKTLDPSLVIIGEVGLGGEVRSILRVENRLKEALNLGFKKVVLPQSVVKNLPAFYKENLTLIGVSKVEEAIEKAFSSI